MDFTYGHQRLTGRLLIAMPGVQDVAFRRSVVMICAHSPHGAMGLVVNRPAPDMTLRRLLLELGRRSDRTPFGHRVHAGGPVQVERAFVLHGPDHDEGAETLKVSDDFYMTSSRSILSEVAEGRGPVDPLIAMGYSGWGPQQLEDELARNVWFVADATPGVVLGGSDAAKWEGALAQAGIGAAQLSGVAGHA
ncbi:YqgE/AlgH family protein [Jannaschia sp. Os4]|uniref:YqgE/AlgH family protein n=1 Tax=Jannaschia sp. Os4 TaxID=2807617 RepID=UPI001939D7C3|nr:YqgE/AlgH family protein [Jannaschia sp. Os4]MBM2574990.1 YqgE/AlgH family protein [Jannaschia sp. Os4]